MQRVTGEYYYFFLNKVKTCENKGEEMKLNENFVYKTIAGQPVVVPVGEAAKKINGIISLNGPAEIIWKCLQDGKGYDEIASSVKAEYDADEEIIKKDLDAFLEKLRGYGILE